MICILMYIVPVTALSLNSIQKSILIISVHLISYLFLFDSVLTYLLNFEQLLKSHWGYLSNSLGTLLSHSQQPTFLQTLGKNVLLAPSALFHISAGTRVSWHKPESPRQSTWPLLWPALVPGPHSSFPGDGCLFLVVAGWHQQQLWWDEMVFHPGQDPARLGLSLQEHYRHNPPLI